LPSQYVTQPARAAPDRYKGNLITTDRGALAQKLQALARAIMPPFALQPTIDFKLGNSPPENAELLAYAEVHDVPSIQDTWLREIRALARPGDILLVEGLDWTFRLLQVDETISPRNLPGVDIRGWEDKLKDFLKVQNILHAKEAE
jgi:hypothetical protein